MTRLILAAAFALVGCASTPPASPPPSPSAYVATGAVAGRIGSELSQRLGEPVRVDCGGTPRRQTGESFTCTATDAAGGRRLVTVTVTGADGEYRWELTR